MHLEHVTFTYEHSRQPAVEDINLDIAPGERLLITGPSGAGKSTLALTICGAIPHVIQGATEGTCRIGDRDTSQTSLSDICRDVGVVLQSPEDQLFSLTVYEDVAFGLLNLRVAAEEVPRRVRAALEQVGMAAYENHASSALSGGQKQRVAIACALALGPRLLVLDEVTAELDVVGSGQVYDVVRSLGDQGTTVVLVDQKVDEVCTWVDRVIYMDAGRIRADMAPRDFIRAALDPESTLAVEVPQVTELAWRMQRRGSWTSRILPMTEEELYEQLPQRVGNN